MSPSWVMWTRKALEDRFHWVQDPTLLSGRYSRRAPAPGSLQLAHLEFVQRLARGCRGRDAQGRPVIALTLFVEQREWPEAHAARRRVSVAGRPEPIGASGEREQLDRSPDGGEHLDAPARELRDDEVAAACRDGRWLLELARGAALASEGTHEAATVDHLCARHLRWPSPLWPGEGALHEEALYAMVEGVGDEEELALPAHAGSRRGAARKSQEA